jgi:hypothetical protein
VRGVEQHLSSALDRQQLESRRPFGTRQSLLDRRPTDPGPGRGGRLEQPDGDQRIADLVLAAQSQRDRTVRPVWRLDRQTCAS